MLCQKVSGRAFRGAFVLLPTNSNHGHSLAAVIDRWGANISVNKPVLEPVAVRVVCFLLRLY